MRLLLTFITIAFLAGSCGSEDTLGMQGEIAEIEAYAARTNLSVQSTDSGLHYNITGPQSGEEPDDSDLAVFNIKQFFIGWYGHNRRRRHFFIH